MNKRTERFIVVGKATEAFKGFRIGFSLFDKLCRNSANPVKAVLLIPSKDTIDDDSILGAFLRGYNSREIIEDIRSGRDVILPCGVPFSLETAESFSDAGDPLIVLAVDVSDGMLSKIDESQNVQAVIVVPNGDGDVEEWVGKWSPKEVAEF